MYNEGSMTNGRAEKTLVTPVVQSFILAEHVYQEAQTGKKVIAGTFQNITTLTFPVVLPKAFIYLALTNARGKLNLQVRVVDLTDDSVLLKSDVVKGEVPDPLLTAEMVMELPGLQFRHPGQYAVEAYCNEQRIAGLRINVKDSREGKQPDGNRA